MNKRVLDTARIEWIRDDQGIDLPRSLAFDDIYFAGNGVEETRHVFIQGNRLVDRFSTREKITIGELGFGTGLNFLVAWQTRDKAQKDADGKGIVPVLDYFSIEKFPLKVEDFERASTAWPELAPYAAQLALRWPAPVEGLHQIHLAPGVTLTVYLGEVMDGLMIARELGVSIDAWFLDGFSPAQNEDMWSQDVADALAGLSHNTPNDPTSLATFTVAGDVRRSLQSAGFSLDKIKGFGRKRHMLIGNYTPDAQSHSTTAPGGQTLADYPATLNTPQAPWFSTQTIDTLSTGASIAIIGGGIAGASLAHALAAVGMQPTIYEARGIASGASGNPAGLIMPRIDRDDSPTARFFIHAWLYVMHLLKQLGHHQLFHPCGISKIGTDLDTIESLRHIAEEEYLPSSMLERLDDGIYFPAAGVIHAQKFVEALIADKPVIKTRVHHIDQYQDRPHLVTDQGTFSHDCVILANGLETLRFKQARTLPLSGSLGQLDIFPEGTAPKQGHVYGPYIAPLPPTGENLTPHGCVVGATYRTLDNASGEMWSEETSYDATCENINRLAAHNPDMAACLSANTATSRARVRCVTPDQMPIVGPLPDWAFYGANYDGIRFGRQWQTTHTPSTPYPLAQYQKNIFALTGLGSRGLVTAPYCAALIAAQLCGTIPPMTLDIQSCIHPGRFFIRTLKKAKPGLAAKS